MIGIAAYKKRVDETVAFLRERFPEVPQVVVVLGTGLGALAEEIVADVVLSYADIPNFPRATVTGHDGRLIMGKLGGRPVAALQGRFHFYEGYSTRELTLPVRVLSLLGAKTMLVINAAGGLDTSYEPGTIMVIRDHLNFIGDNPLRGPNVEAWGGRFPDFSEPYDRELIAAALGGAARLALNRVVAGVYVAVAGPSLETAAETRYLRQCGADAVGMSTVPEVIVARHGGLRVLGLSLIANVNDPDNFAPILLDEVIARVADAVPRLRRLIMGLLPEL